IQSRRGAHLLAACAVGENGGAAIVGGSTQLPTLGFRDGRAIHWWGGHAATRSRVAVVETSRRREVDSAISARAGRRTARAHADCASPAAEIGRVSPGSRRTTEGNHQTGEDRTEGPGNRFHLPT